MAMGNGYTPLFSSLTTGTLCGRWPDIGLWPIVLSLSDRNGVVDVTPDYLARITGLAIEEVIACMKRFCEPDAYSRTPTNGGARLALLDGHRDWGWRIINHSLYRERARKAASDAERAADGRNAARMRMRRSQEIETSGDPRRPADTRANPLLDKDKDKDPDLCVERAFTFEAVRAGYPKFSGRQDWLTAEHHCGLLVERGEATWELLAKSAERYAAYCAAGGVSGPQFVMTPGKFFSAADKPWSQLWTPPESKSAQRVNSNISAAAEAKRRIFGGSGS